jgi:glutamyl-tRNA synthetase
VSVGPVGRLAPSPTGLLHLGHARSFLLAWWSVRSAGGTLRLRLEDLDRSRVKPGMVEACLRDLEWLGLDWDGPVVLQSDHEGELYETALELLRLGHAYPCICTRREISEAQSAPHADQENSVYPGTCRGRFKSLEEARRASGREPALRLKVTPGEITIQDRLHGELCQDLEREVGDFPITSRDGQVAYQLAVVLDDARQGITEVLRGDDLLSSTPRQVLLYSLLGLKPPSWIHVPLVLDESGERLAKRHDALSLAALREAGVKAESLVAWLARSCGFLACGPLSARDLLEGFDLGRLKLTPVTFDGRARKEIEDSTQS